MAGTVEFNDQFQRQATKIHNGIVEGQLAAKLVVEQLAIAE